MGQYEAENSQACCRQAHPKHSCEFCMVFTRSIRRGTNVPQSFFIASSTHVSALRMLVSSPGDPPGGPRERPAAGACCACCQGTSCASALLRALHHCHCLPALHSSHHIVQDLTSTYFSVSAPGCCAVYNKLQMHLYGQQQSNKLE